jgi:putative Mn2+ efflux pump MntP
MDNNISNYVLVGFVILASMFIGLRMIRSHLKTKEKSRLINNSMRNNDGHYGPSRYYYSEDDKN